MDLLGTLPSVHVTVQYNLVSMDLYGIESTADVLVYRDFAVPDMC
jgi:hypothetical protein